MIDISFATMIWDILNYNYIWFSLLTLLLASFTMWFSQSVIGFTSVFGIFTILGVILGYYQMWYLILIVLVMFSLSFFGNEYALKRFRI